MNMKCRNGFSGMTAGRVVLVAVLVMLSSLSGFGRGPKQETIEAMAMGTGTQTGRTFGVTLNIAEFSTPEDKQILIDSYAKAQNQGLYNALRKMRAVGHIEVTGTVGYDCVYISMVPTAEGRRIRFITNRPITFGEAWTDSNSMSYDMTVGEIMLNDQEKHKSTGKLFPAVQIVLDKMGQPQIELYQNAWALSDVLDWKGTPGVN